MIITMDGPVDITDLIASAHMDLDGYDVHTVPGSIEPDTETIAIFDYDYHIAIITNINLDTPDIIETILRDIAGDDYDNFINIDHAVALYNVHPGFAARRSTKSRWAYTLKYIEKTFYI